MRRPLTNLARKSGALAMVAVDQREALRGMFAQHQSTPVTDAQLTGFKVDVARELSPFASALLVDQEFGIDAIIQSESLTPTCGLIAATDLLIGPAGGAATDTDLDLDVDPLRMKAIGSVGLKFLILWRHDESVEQRQILIDRFNALCEASDLPSIIEVIVKPSHDTSREFNREADIITAAKEASKWRADLYKAEVPFHGEGDLHKISQNSEAISEAISGPWVVLSNGVKAPYFADAVTACAKGGASGFLAGRAVWADIVGSADIPAALRDVSIPRLAKLAEIVDTYARPWTDWK